MDIRDIAKMKIIFYPKYKLAYTASAFPEVPCVYFLILDTKVHYIGQTKNLRQRMSNHLGLTSFVSFNAIGFIEMKELDDRLVYETEMTEKYLNFLYPPYDINSVDKVFQ